MDALQKKMRELGIFEKDILEKFILGSGSGGQKINKTSSCVYLQHLPTGIEIKCQQERSRELNRYQARMELCERIENQREKERQDIQYAKEKVRRQKKGRSRVGQEKVLKNKKRQSEKKRLRKPQSAESS